MGLTTWQAEKERQGLAGSRDARAVVVPAVRQLKVCERERERKNGELLLLLLLLLYEPVKAL